VLFDLGHTVDIVSLQESESGSRLLSQDRTAHWVLWDLSARRVLLEGDDGQVIEYPPAVTGGPVLVGSTLVVVGSGLLRVHDAITGELHFSMPASPTQFGVAQDGSYVWTADSSALNLWSALDGNNIAARPGNYDTARLFAAPAEARVALGPAGAQVIERIGTDGSQTVTSSFSGDFSSWFTDGQHFLTSLGTTVWVYDAAATQTGIWSVPIPANYANLTGQGAYFWTLAFPGQLTLYSITGGGTPVATYNETESATAFGVGSMIGVLPFPPAGTLQLIDLSGSGPTVTSYQVPIAYLEAFTADASGHWAVGNRHGVVYDSDAVTGGLPPVGLGNVLSVAGAPTGRAAAATAGGLVLLFDVTSSLEPNGTIAFASSHLELSSDGTVLAAAGNLLDGQFWQDDSLRFYTLPAATLSRSFPYTWSGSPHFFDFSLSASGSRFGRITGTLGSGAFNREIDGASGTILSDVLAHWHVADKEISFYPYPPILLAPTGPGIALPDQGRLSTATTRIYSDATLVSAVPGYALGWLADDRLLVDTYAPQGYSDGFAGSRLYDAAGNFVATSPLPQIASLQVVSDTRVYDRLYNVVYDTGDGTVVWSGPDLCCSEGAVAGPYVLFAADGHLVAARY